MDKNTSLAFKILGFSIGMICLAYAAFPLYTLFCKVTGYGGTPKQVSSVNPPSMELGTKNITVRFNADKDSHLAWEFSPVQKQMLVRTGEKHLALFRAKNVSDKPVTGMATFNVTPDKAAIYFNKIQCFCFDKQTLNAGEEVQMPVSFYIDPAIEKDLNTKEISTVTLSYTFFLDADSQKQE